MTSSFKPPAMRAYAKKIDEIVERAVGRWAAQDEVLFYDEMKRLLLEIAFDAFYETIRMHPPVPLFLRRTIRACEMGGVQVPADTMVCVPSTYIHRLPDWWDEPDRFDPWRFSDDVAEHRKHNFMWVPFGGGAHKCIGMHFARMLFLLTFRKVLASYRMEFGKNDYYPAKLQHFPFTRPLDNLPVRLVARTADPRASS